MELHEIASALLAIILIDLVLAGDNAIVIALAASCTTPAFAQRAGDTPTNLDRIEITGSRGRIKLEFFSDAPLRLHDEAGVEEAAIVNPPHVQQPFIQSIVNDLNGLSPCPGDPASAMRATWAADEILKDFRNSGR